jgi:para-aminobenzoate synthetase component 1
MLKEYVGEINSLFFKKIPFIIIVDYKIENVHIFRLDALPEDLLIDCPIFSNGSKDIEVCDFSFKKYNFSFDQYKKGFDNVLSHINRGDSYLLNLTAKSKIEIDLSLEDIFYMSSAPYKLKYKDLFTVFSPEKFVDIKEGMIYTYPMKGTIDARIENAKQILLNNKKELAEHSTIVDLLRNDMSRVAKQVKVDKFRYLEKINTIRKDLYQTSSRVSGKLNNDVGLGDVLNEMLPAGSICGAPKEKTLEIIAESELDDRGYYTGVFGVFDGKQFTSAVMIRFIEQVGSDMFYRSGGGITYNSILKDEYDELIDKIYVPISRNN